MGKITSHVLDTSIGKPAAGIRIVLEKNSGQPLSATWEAVGEGVTNQDGRIGDLFAGDRLGGHYRANFFVDKYFQSRQTESFYPVVRIEFLAKDTDDHYHIPLLLNPFGYSTYRGS